MFRSKGILFLICYPCVKRADHNIIQLPIAYLTSSSREKLNVMMIQWSIDDS